MKFWHFIQLSLILGGNLIPAWAAAASGMGLAEGLRELIKSDEQELAQRPLVSPTATFTLTDQGQNLDPYFVRSLLLFSDPAYLALARQDQCHFYAALDNDLLKTSQGPVRQVLIQAQGRTAYSVSRQEFITATHKLCPQNQENARLFSLENLPTTISRLEFPLPQNEKDCQKIWQDWWQNPYTPYLCRIAQTQRLAYEADGQLKSIDAALGQESKNDTAQIKAYGYWQQIKKRHQTYQSILNFEQRTYLNHLCPHLDDQQAYCRNYFTHDVWARALQGQVPFSYMAYLCQDLYHKDFASPRELEPCHAPLEARPETCLTAFNGQTFYPAPDCAQLQILADGRLQTNYHDCAAHFDYPELANWFRISQHFASFEQDKINPQSTHTPSKTTPSADLSLGLTPPLTLPQCFFQVAHPVYLALAAQDHLDLWPYELCYDDVYKVKEICTPFVPGQGDAPYAQENLITTALRRSSDRLDVQCKFVEEKQYRPSTLAYSTGCFITYNPEQCNAFNCPTDIKVHKRTMGQVKYQGKIDLAYFPTSYATAEKSLFKIMGRYLKREQKLIRNLTELFYFLETNPRGLIHGMACLEDILPEYFAKKSYGQCRPYPFIIDGQEKVASDTFLSVHLPLDDVHLPRRIRWQNIYQGVVNLQQIHPMKSWAMYGIW